MTFPKPIISIKSEAQIAFTQSRYLHLHKKIPYYYENIYGMLISPQIHSSPNWLLASVLYASILLLLYHAVTIL
jgi:hypothetical protein